VLDSLAYIIVGLVILAKASEYAVKSIANIARLFHFSEFATSFVIVGIAAVMPEFFVAVSSSLNKVSSLGLGVLIGSNVIDLTVIIALVVLIAGRIKINTKLAQWGNWYVIINAIPVLLLLDGSLSALDGVILVFVFLFYVTFTLARGRKMLGGRKKRSIGEVLKEFLIAGISLAILFWSADLIVTNAKMISEKIAFPLVFTGFFVSFGTCFPELIFALKAAKEKHGELGLGAIMGNVVVDSTFSIGVISLMGPISPPLIMTVLSGLFMVISSLVVIHFIKNDREITRSDGILLLILYLIFGLVEFWVKTVTVG
jgi:cation:H+ antiporter